MKFETFSRDDSDPSYWLLVLTSADGHVIKTLRFRLGEDYDLTTFDGRLASVRILSAV